MKSTTKILLFLFVLTAVTGFAQSHHDQSKEDPFTLKKITDNVYALFGRGGNIGVVIGPDAVLIIDSQYRELAPGIEAKIKTITPKPIKYLLNTHHHGDHVGGNEHFIKFTMVIAHDNVRKRMLGSPEQVLKLYPQALEEAKKEGNKDSIKFFEEQIAWAKKVKVEEIAAPFLTFDSEFRIHFGNETINVWHTPPAHTDGDSVVFLPQAKVLHLGDLGFNKVIPFVDVYNGGSIKGYFEAFEQLRKKTPADAVIIPGHGEVTNWEGMKALTGFLQKILDEAAAAKKKGTSKKDFVNTLQLPEYKDWPGYDSRFKENLDVAYEAAQ